MAFAASVCIAMAVPSVLSAVRDAGAGRAALEYAGEEIRRGDADGAQRMFTTATQRFDAAAERLGSRWTRAARTIPLVGRQLRVLHALTRAGALAAGAATGPTIALSRQPPGGWGLHNGRIDLRLMAEAGAVLRSAAPIAGRAAQNLSAAPKSWLAPPLADARASAERALRRASHSMARGATGLEAMAAVLGKTGTRRYLVMSSNLAELRGTGGLLGFFAVIEARAGELRLRPEKGRPSIALPPLAEQRLSPPRWYVDTWGRYEPLRTWHNVNMTADFPTVGDLIVDAVSSPPGPFDGVVQIDPYGLSALLSLTGPIELPDWPEPIGAANVARVAQHELYLRYPDAAERDAFGEQLITGVFRKVLASKWRLDRTALERLAGAVAGGHIKMYLDDIGGQRLLRRLGLDGGLAGTETANDVIGVFNQNASPNKVDWFLRRSIGYELRLDPHSGTAAAKLVVDLRNEAPSRGLPEYILGPNGGGIAPGENRSILVLLRPANSRLTNISVNGMPAVATIDRERNLLAHQLPVTIPPGGGLRIEASYSMHAPLEFRDGARTYRLHLLRQPAVASDQYHIRIVVPPTWRLSGPAKVRGALSGSQTLEFHVAERGLLRPFHSIGRLMRDLVAFRPGRSSERVSPGAEPARP